MNKTLKASNTRVGQVLIAMVVMFSLTSLHNIFLNNVSAQRSKLETPIAIDIDSGIAPLTGKRVMYQLTDEEGGLILEATGQTRKVPAIITYNYRTNRDESGRLVSPLFILRPGFAGGPFSKDEAVLDSARSPGTWDPFKPGDQRN